MPSDKRTPGVIPSERSESRDLHLPFTSFAEALFDNRWSGKNSSTQHCNTVERRRPVWHGAMGRGLTRLPLSGALAAPSRRRRITGV